MKRLEYRRLKANQLMKFRDHNREKTITSTYTDDILGMSIFKKEATQAQIKLVEKYEIKDLGEIKFILEICITCNRS